VGASRAMNLKQAYELAKSHKFDLCLTDMRLPDGNGIDLVRYMQQHCPNVPVAMITAHGNMDTAIEALKAGAFDFVSKPVDLKVLRNLVNTALRLGERRAPPARRLIGESEVMQKLRTTIAKLARSQAPVYISGESGTGKELAARMIHEQGPRADAPFVPVNCGAIPAELMESELFGHKKGSFTGAVAEKAGLFQAADGGTLFLDEVADLPLLMQVKLLRAIQEKAVRPVGSEKEVPVDVRILSASHRDLAALVAAERFRQDLYFRLDVINLTVPSLRDRPEDIPELCAHVLSRLAGQSASGVPTLSDDAVALLQSYPFPGNVRELENVLERAMTLCEGSEIQAADLGLPGNVQSEAVTGEVEGQSPESDDLDAVLESVERKTILNALEQSRWNKTAAAKLLGISFGALRYRMQKFRID
ncbi:MAG: sigma-54 dependent transcriptional regulator, partial [Gammaproteobacteria bacterium]|nr:sigma-54 dependent transcriptional regulator [Gammaproteobacteria bacterium]